MVGLEVLGLLLDSMILVVFSNLNHYTILRGGAGLPTPPALSAAAPGAAAAQSREQWEERHGNLSCRIGKDFVVI